MIKKPNGNGIAMDARRRKSGEISRLTTIRKCAAISRTDRRQNVDGAVSGPESPRCCRARDGRARFVDLIFQIDDLREQLQIFIDDRTDQTKIASAVLANKRLLVEILEAVRALHSIPRAVSFFFGPSRPCRSASSRRRVATRSLSSAFSSISDSGIFRSLPQWRQIEASAWTSSLQNGQRAVALAPALSRCLILRPTPI